MPSTTYPYMVYEVPFSVHGERVREPTPLPESGFPKSDSL
jgi:hypothetical protein